jgi:DNA-binding response OmpR family regulator
MLKTRILIVDDNATNLSILEELLGDDHELYMASSGIEAVDVSEIFQPDIVLLDVMMPGIDGYETCRRLRKGVARRAKILMISARAMASERVAGYEAGADDYVTKPFSSDELLSKVRVYRQLRSAEEISQCKQSLLSILHHGDQTPTQKMVETSLILLGKLAAGSDEANLAQSILQQAKCMNEWLYQGDLLMRLMNGEYRSQMQLIDFRNEWDAVAAEVITPELKKQHRWYSSAPASLPIAGDATLLRTAIRAMFQFALRHADASGEISSNVTCDQGSMNLSFRIGGTPLSTTEIANVFEPFEIAGRSGQPSLAMGMAIARYTMQLHHGRLQVNSQYEDGIELTLTLKLGSGGKPLLFESVSSANYVPGANSFQATAAQ